MDQFVVMDRHVEAAPSAAGSGSVVLSRLPPGRSLLNACRPSLKLVLEGEQHYVIDGRTIAVGPGQYLYLDAGSQFVAHNRRKTTGLCLGIGPAGLAGGTGEGHDPVLGAPWSCRPRAAQWAASSISMRGRSPRIPPWATASPRR